MRWCSYVTPIESITLLCTACLLSVPVCSQVSTTTGSVFADKSIPMTVQKVVQEVDVIFTVKDRHGRSVRNLTAADISILDNGEPPEHITYFKSHARLPLRLALVIDTSDSVLPNTGFEKKAAEIFLKHEMHSISDLALVVGFNERARIEQTPTNDPHLLTRAIRHLPLGGKTAVFDAVALASTQLGSIPNTAASLRAIILMTDGDDNSSKVSLHEAEIAAEQNETIVYTINTGIGSLRGGSAEKNIKALSETTGGGYFLADEEHIREALVKIEEDIQNQYLVGYRPAQTKPDGSFHRISILVPKKLRARHRQGYFAR
jgi:VWFA-related protein